MNMFQVKKDLLYFTERKFARAENLGVRSSGFLDRRSLKSFQSSILAGKDIVDKHERDFLSDGVQKPKWGTSAFLHGKFNKGPYLFEIGIPRPVSLPNRASDC